MATSTAVTSFAWFRAEVHQFKRERVLAGLGALTAQVWASTSGKTTVDLPIYPWQAGLVAREALLAPSNSRCGARTPTGADLVRLCRITDTLDQPVFHAGADLHEYGLQVAHLQFPYSEDQYGPIARLLPLLDREFPRPPFEVMSRDAICEVLGGPLDVFVDSAPFFSAAAIRNGGRFEEAWLAGPQFDEVRAEIHLDVLMSVFRHAWASTIPALRDRARSSTSANPLHRPFDWNPLQARPYVKLSDGSHVAPNAWWAHNRVSPTAIYHLGMDRHHESWARDLGRAQEDYLLQQLRQLEPLAQVIPEFEYPTRNGTVRTVDAFVVFDDLVVLIESKSVRVRLGSTTSADAYRELLRRDLDKAYRRQLPRSVDLVRDDHPNLGGNVRGKPIIALVVTPDPSTRPILLPSSPRSRRPQSRRH